MSSILSSSATSFTPPSAETVRTQLEILNKVIAELKAAEQAYESEKNEEVKAALKNALDDAKKACAIQLRLTATKLGSGRRKTHRRKHRRRSTRALTARRR